MKACRLTEENSVDIFRQALAGISLDRMRAHIRALELTRHLVEATAALGKAADYI